jgi:hypothetical protein
MRPSLGSCADCWCWGWLTRGAYCATCYDYRRFDGVEYCLGCGRSLGIRQGACRLCRAQAALQLGQTRVRGPLPTGLVLRAWQLFLLDVPQPRLALRQQRCPQQPSAAYHRIPGQLALFPAEGRDYNRFDRARHADPRNPALIAARAQAAWMAELSGWSPYLIEEVDLALVMLLSDHADGERVRYSQMLPIDKRGANVCRTAEVLDASGCSTTIAATASLAGWKYASPIWRQASPPRSVHMRYPDGSAPLPANTSAGQPRGCPGLLGGDTAVSITDATGRRQR